MKERFGAYTLLRRLAVGGMAEIFLARLAYAAPDAPCVVIKRILPHLSSDARFVRMFIDEARLAVGLVHDNIVRTLDFGRVGHEHYLSMAYVPGVDLQCLLARGLSGGPRLEIGASAVLGLDLARGLAYAHRYVSADGTAQHVVHRDVSPHNVMVHGQGTAMVMDFGIAKAALCANRTATGVGAIKGKLSYMAPEQAWGERTTQAVDQYALGVVLWECLANRRLFGDAPERRLVGAGNAPEVPHLRTVAPNVSQALADAVMRALAVGPLQRFGHVEDLAAALASALGTMPGGEAGGRAALSARVRAEVAHAEATPLADWSWQHEQRAAGTRIHSLGRTAAVIAQPSNLRAGSETSLPGTGRRFGGRLRPHRELAPRRPGMAKLPVRRRRPVVRPALASRMWWALYAAACGAAGHALWPQVFAPLVRLSDVSGARICLP